MCGINFILDKTGSLDDGSILRMESATRHRGPDHSGFHSVRLANERLFFAASRLKIMDLSDKANQPIVTEDGNYVLVYNGELYNYHDFKNILISKGYRFQSSSDSEVLFFALIEHGESIIEKLNGMFAFVFYDKRNQHIIAARDGRGMKPLFYFDNDRYMIISSEIRGILASGLVQKQLNEAQIPHYLKFRYAKKPQTFFKNILELKEGQLLIKKGDENLVLKNSQNIISTSSDISSEQLVETVDEHIYNAFLRHTVADAPLGLFLSGGIDSTLLLALSHREVIPMPTFSIVHDKNVGSFGTEDRHYSRLAVKKFGNSIDHHEILATPDILDELDDLVGQLDQPVADSASLLTWYLSRYAKNTVKTVLSGAGADELFAGYNRHHAFYHYLKHYSAYRKYMGLLKVLGTTLPTGFDHPFRKYFRLANKFIKDLDKNPVQTFSNFTALDFNIAIDDPSDTDTNVKDISHYLYQALQQDLHNYLISDVLTVNDRMGMAHGLEMRMPYLDDELCKLILSVDPLKLVKDGKKWILKTILTRLGGSEFCNRPKEGFGLPFGKWIRIKDLGLPDLFNDKQQIIHKFVSSEQCRKMYHNHMNRKADHASELWAYVVLVKWLNLNGFGQ